MDVLVLKQNTTGPRRRAGFTALPFPHTALLSVTYGLPWQRELHLQTITGLTEWQCYILVTDNP
jgi:hypothetical protein